MVTRFYFGKVRDLEELAKNQEDETFVATDETGKVRCEFCVDEIHELFNQKEDIYPEDLDDDRVIGTADVADFDVYVETLASAAKGKRIVVPDDSTIEENEVIFFDC